MLKNSLYSVVIYVLFSSAVFADDTYKPPKMFVAPSPVQAIPAPVVEVDVFKPSRKPVYKSKKKAPLVVGKDLGVSKVVVKARPAGAPSVEAESLMPSPSEKTPRIDAADRSSIETSIAFLPFAIDLTKTQKSKFKDIIDTYFIERDAKSIVVKVYASIGEEEKQNSAKRKALSRALSVRDWLLDLGVKTDQITLKAIGEARDKGLPDRADIEILF